MVTIGKNIDFGMLICQTLYNFWLGFGNDEND